MVASSDLYPEVNKNWLDQTNKLTNIISETNEARENANMIAFVAEVYKNIESMARKYLNPAKSTR